MTPDSFSDGGLCFDSKQALAYAQKMIDEGADILDVGAESTRPGATPISSAEELKRLLPVVEPLLQNTSLPISIDTSKPEVMHEMAQLGVSIINDVRAFTEPGALEAVAKTDLTLCLMHMQDSPQKMQEAPNYKDVVQEVFSFLEQRIKACSAAGIDPERLWIDPGFGFGKTVEHNLCLLKELAQFKRLELPILVGLSRKSMIGSLLNLPVSERLHGSIACAVIAAMNGAEIIRVHDVKATVEALTLLAATRAV